MDKVKKILKISYIIGCIVIATAMLNKMFAASSVSNDDITDISTHIGLGVYSLKETESKDDPISTGKAGLLGRMDPSQIEAFAHGEYDISSISGELVENRKIFGGTTKSAILIAELENMSDVFCLNKKGKLPNYYGLENEYIKFGASGARDAYESYVNGTYVNNNPVNGDYFDTGYYIDFACILLSRKYDFSNLTVREAYTENASEYDSNMDKIDWDVAYILSQAGNDVVYYPDENGYRYDQYQWAIWKCTDSNIDLSTKQNPVEEFNSLYIYNKAQAFKSYRENIDKNAFVTVEDDDEYTFKYNIKGDFFLAGPITINYGDLTAELNGATVKVGEITECHLYGEYDERDGDLQQEIENYKFTDENGVELGPECLETTVDGKKFPKSEQEFYIKVENNEPIYNDSTNSTHNSQGIKRIESFEAKFRYMDVEASACTVKDESDEGALQFYDWVEIDDRGTLRRNNKLEPIRLQPILVMRGAKLYWRNFEFKINFGEDDETPSPSITPSPSTTPPTTMTPTTTPPTTMTPSTTPPGQNTYIDIGGKVWVDVGDRDKDNEREGIYIEGTKDYPRQNVLVTLYFTNGEIVREGTHTIPLWTGGERTVEIPHDSRNDAGFKTAEELKDGGAQKFQMYTNDENGDYMFYGLPVDFQYYVEFTYDGLSYEPVDNFVVGYDQNGNILIDKDEYLNNPNSVKYSIMGNNPYHNNSKAEESESDRYNFNKKFTTITPSSSMSTGSDGNPLNNQQSYSEGESIPKFLLDYYTTKSKLSYRGKEYEYIESRLITTNNPENDTNSDTTVPQTGKAKDYAQISAKTVINYPRYQLLDGTWIVDDNNVSNRNDAWLVIASSSSYELVDNTEYLKHINLGLKRRSSADLQLTMQILGGATTIKDKSKVVQYTLLDTEPTMDITKLEDEYIKQEISASDYNWKANYDNIYREDSTAYVVDKASLKVYVLYKINITDQCFSPDDYGVVTSLVDYYSDNGLEYLTKQEEIETAYALFKKEIFDGKQAVPLSSKASWIAGTNTEVEWKEAGSVNGYKKLEANNLNLKVDDETVSIYLMMKVKENGDVLYKGTENGSDGMKNIAEINGYQIMTKTSNGNVPAGKVDANSIPGNAIPGNKNTYENDTGKAPVFTLELNWNPRKIEGFVWDDTNGNGTLDKTKGINNVTVQLYEYVYEEYEENGQKKYRNPKKIQRPGLVFTKDENGNNIVKASKEDTVLTGNGDWETGYYEFYVEGGNYSVEFIYGDERILKTNTKYNAQDYQATHPYNALRNLSQYKDSGIYNKAYSTEVKLQNALNGGINQSFIDLSKGFGEVEMITEYPLQSYIETKNESNLYKGENTSSNARDNAQIRKYLIEKVQTLTYENSSILHKLSTDLSGATETELKELSNYTRMEAVSDIITISANDLANKENYEGSKNVSKVINLGLKERPQASVKLEKQVDRIVLTTEDGTVLIDTLDATKIKNLQKIDDIQETFMYLDASVMEGATIDIYYTVTMTNDAEKDDKLENYIYETDKGIYDNNKSDEDIIGELVNSINGRFGTTVTTSTNLPIKATIYDYVNKNLEYREVDNQNINENNAKWEVIDIKDIDGKDLNGISSNVKQKLKRTGNEKKVSKILKTETIELTAGKSDVFTLHLGMTLAENTEEDITDEFVYSNSAEIVQIDSRAGRRDYETIQGNYEPYTTPSEPDSAMTGTTTVLVPFGQERVYYVITALVVGIIITGVLIIKKKVLKK